MYALYEFWSTKMYIKCINKSARKQGETWMTQKDIGPQINRNVLYQDVAHDQSVQLHIKSTEIWIVDGRTALHRCNAHQCTTSVAELAVHKVRLVARTSTTRPYLLCKKSGMSASNLQHIRIQHNGHARERRTRPSLF